MIELWFELVQPNLRKHKGIINMLSTSDKCHFLWGFFLMGHPLPANICTGSSLFLIHSPPCPTNQLIFKISAKTSPLLGSLLWEEKQNRNQNQGVKIFQMLMICDLPNYSTLSKNQHAIPQGWGWLTQRCLYFKWEAIVPTHGQWNWFSSKKQLLWSQAAWIRNV